MKKSQLEILRGDMRTRDVLEVIMLDNEEARRNIKPILANLDKIKELHGALDWWVSMSGETPLGLLSVVNYRSHSQYLYSWISPQVNEDFELVASELLKEWIKTSKAEWFHVDIDPESEILAIILRNRFKFDKNLLATYSVKTGFFDSEMPQEYYIRKPEDDEMEWIYDNLIAKDMVKGSPISISKSQFLHFAKSNELNENWIVMVDMKENILGFGASHLEQRGGGRISPVMYGPHTFDPFVASMIIAEFLTFWKMQQQEMLIIRRSRELNQDILTRFDIDIINAMSINRYSYKKSILRDFFS